ncbi:GntR family transcriptional regulator [Candidimonas nitroreducens]|uniref:GntR family transcriptional regulator n=2 Tax=Candidimonas nitroreducens TaxID=683354 RepID=A0A225MS40_9BURK|nr:GntR family transcriptional regulator [Candidimonas nitroreducens]
MSKRTTMTEARARLGAICDTHVHIFESRERYPLKTGELRSEPPDAPLARLLAESGPEGVRRVVFDQPSHYGYDNRCILDAVETLGRDRARAIVSIDENTVTDTELDALHARGARSIRVNYGYRSTDPDITRRAAEHAHKLASRAADRGWHLEFLVPNRALRELLPTLAGLPCDFSVGHMGVFPAEKGVSQEGFADFLRLHAMGRCWIKFTGVYRISKAPDFTDIEPMARAFVQNNPDRIVWGSDWPFLSHLDVVTYPQLLGLFEQWVPDAATQRRILVENPARLFDF